MSTRLAQLFDSSWYAHLHRFNFLPSQILHPSWLTRFSPQGVIAALGPQLEPADLHRHWSMHILALLGLTDRPCLDSGAALLPLAILPAPQFERLVALAGLSLNGKALRQLIRRDDITTLRRVLAPDLLAFTLHDASRFHPGLALEHDDVSGLLERSGALGAGALLCAMQGAPDEMFERVRLRLDAATALPAALPFAVEVDEALALMLQLTDFLDPAWLSSFDPRH